MTAPTRVHDAHCHQYRKPDAGAVGRRPRAVFLQLWVDM